MKHDGENGECQRDYRTVGKKGIYVWTVKVIWGQCFKLFLVTLADGFYDLFYFSFGVIVNYEAISNVKLGWKKCITL